MFYLKPPRHISTLPNPEVAVGFSHFRFNPDNGHPHGAWQISIPQTPCSILQTVSHDELVTLVCPSK
jgi:hypothetical protein